MVATDIHESTERCNKVIEILKGLNGHKQTFLFTVLFIFLLSNCAPTPITPSLVVLLPTSAPTATVPPRVSPSPLPLPLCPSQRPMETPARPAAFEEYASVLRQYLSAGGAPETLPSILLTWEVLPDEGLGWTQADLTGDDVAESVVAFVNPESDFYPPETQLVVYTCRPGTMDTMYVYQPGAGFGLNLIGAEDLTGDGPAEITFAEIACGAHTCWHTLHVWSWMNTDFTEHAVTNFSVPYPTFYLQAGQLLAVSGGIASVGAGPQRSVTTTLTWNGTIITPTATQVAPAVYRYHVFQDGETAFFAGDYGHAQLSYLKVLEDTGLEPWAEVYSTQEEWRWFDALAHWRLILINIQLQDNELAEQHYHQLEQDFPAGVPGNTVTSLADYFWETYSATYTLAEGCQSILNVPEIQEILDFLNSFGYANPTYIPEDLCPFPIH
ncbi:MAG: hypothetical protein JXA33_02765 [Anaerolineae bacterium]|nr:hypothetical protein [Anaerolineae bacterium]